MKNLYVHIRQDNWKREVEARRAGICGNGSQGRVRVMTLGAIEGMLSEFHWEVTKLSLARPMDHWPEPNLILDLQRWVVEKIQKSTTPSYRFDFGLRSSEVRFVQNAYGEPLWVAEDVFRALGLTWRGHQSVAYVPAKWRPIELLPYGIDVKHRTCLHWPGLKKVLGGANRPKSWAFMDDLMARFGEGFPDLFIEHQ
jgi:hypothetical protein